MKTDVTAVIDEAPWSGFQITILILCALVTLLDGLDIQALSIVIPQIAHDWNVEPKALGPVLSATFAGIAIGAVSFGLLGDRYGRKRITLTAFALVGIATLSAAFARNIDELLILRFVAGTGIGGALPNATALTSEFMPARKRVFLVSVMFCGIPAGSALAALIWPLFFNSFGWRSVFIFGGVAPLLLLPISAALLPESLRYLMSRDHLRPEAIKTLRRIDPSRSNLQADELIIPEQVTGLPLSKLFVDGQIGITLPIWFIFFSSFFGFYLITSWLPVIFAQEGWTKGDAVRTVAAFQIGTLLGALLCGWLIDRSRTFVVIGSFYLSACALVLVIAFFHHVVAPTMTIMTLAGIGFGGPQVCIVAVAAEVYKRAVRATGVGWALGVGRIGAVVSPIIAGYALAAHWAAGSVLILAAIPAAACSIACLILAARGVAHRPIPASGLDATVQV